MYYGLAPCWVALAPVGPGSKYFPSKIYNWDDIDVMPNRKLMGPVCQSSRAHKVGIQASSTLSNCISMDKQSF